MTKISISDSLYAYWRYLIFLLREFKVPILLTIISIAGGGVLIFIGYQEPETGKTVTLPEAFYCMLMMLINQTPLKFPEVWYLAILFTISPFLGIFLVIEGVLHFGILLFLKRQKSKEWWIMKASLLRNHIIVAGMGRVGYKIVKELLQRGEKVVVINNRTDEYFVEELQEKDVIFIFGNMRLKKTLEEANLSHAKAILFVTGDDLVNIDSALTTKQIRQDMRVALRIFDDTLAENISKAFNFSVISTSAVAASHFVSLVLDKDKFLKQAKDIKSS